MITVKFLLVNIFLIAVIVVVAVCSIIRIKRKELKITRLILLLLFVLVLLKVEYKLYQKTKDFQLIFVIDNSYSMKINDRLNKVKFFLKKNYEEIKKYRKKVYCFNEDVYQVKNFEEIEVTNKSTKINNSLDEIINEISSPAIVFLFSDGINFTDELPFYNKENVKVVPVFIDDKNFKDRSIVDVRYSKIGFKGIDHEIKIYVFSYGYPSTVSKIKLVDVDTNNILSQENFYIKEGLNEFVLKFTPSKIGINRVKLVLENLQEEATFENNVFYFNIEIKKNKIRVLYLCGRPSAEYFNLRSLMKNDPYIDLVSFVILRNPEDVAIVPDTDSALIPFPTYDIFVKELNDFDLVIFENFTYRKFGIPLEYLENLRKFVISGKSFIMIGGENSFFLGGYKFTPIEDILPVYLSEKERFLYEEIKPDFVNLNDKLTNIFEDKIENELYWKNIPSLGNYQTLLDKKDSTILLKYKNNVIMAYNKVGKGIVFISATNSTWRWRLGSILSDKYNFRDFYDKFWKKIIYYCAGIEEIKNINIVCDENYKVLEEVSFNVLLYNISNITSVEAYLILPDLSKKILSVKKTKENNFYCSFVPDLVGKYTINVVVKTEKNVFREQKTVNIMEAQYKEISYLKPNLEYMKKLANFYNTEVEQLETLDIIKKIQDINKEFSEKYSQNVSLYKHPLWGFMFILVFVIEIYIARFK